MASGDKPNESPAPEAGQATDTPPGTTPGPKPTAATKPRASSGGWMWLWGLFAAFAFAGAVGYGVYFFSERTHAQSVEQQVQAQVAERTEAAKAEMQQGPPPTKVRVGAVTKQLTQEWIPVVGRLREVRRSTIASEVQGKVVKVLTPAGTQVVGGQTVIARVDQVWSQLALRQATADLEAGEATASQSKQELAHLEKLAQRGSADPQAIADARAKAKADAAAVLALAAALERAKVASERIEIKAPFDGTVTKKLTEEGQWLDPGSPVVEIVSRGEIDAVIDVPEQYITQLKKGTPVQLTIEPLDLPTITDEVHAINPDGLNPAKTYPVKVRIDDLEGKLKVGMSVTARLPVRAKNEHLMVPIDAVQYQNGQAQVWLALDIPNPKPGPKAMPLDVQVLFKLINEQDKSKSLYAVRPLPKVDNVGLAPGMQVVVQGAERLWPMRPLIIMPGAGKGEGGDKGTGQDQVEDQGGEAQGKPQDRKDGGQGKPE